MYTEKFVKKKLAVKFSIKLVNRLIENMQLGYNSASLPFPKALSHLVKREFNDEFEISCGVRKRQHPMDPDVDILTIKIH